MQNINSKDIYLGKAKFGSPSEGGRLNRSFIHYHSGLPELDNHLNNENITLEAMNAEFGIVIFQDFVAFILYRGEKPIWRFLIKRDSIKRIDVHHEQLLNIRKDSKISGGVLGAVSSMGILGGIVAGTIDALTSDKKIPEGGVLGSLFEIIVQETDEEEKVVFSCTDKKKTKIEEFVSKITF